MCDARDLRLLFNFQVSIARTTNLTHTTRRTSLVKETLSRFSTRNNACQNADLLCNIGSKLISKHLRDKRYTCRSRDSVILRSKSQFGAPIALLHFETPRESKHNIVTICVSIFVAPASSQRFRATCFRHTNTLSSAHMAPTTYEANCHCGAIRYKVTLEDALAPEGTEKVNRCNCSICTKYGM
jgi:hypothetical protein